MHHDQEVCCHTSCRHLHVYVELDSLVNQKCDKKFQETVKDAAKPSKGSYPMLGSTTCLNQSSEVDDISAQQETGDRSRDENGGRNASMLAQKHCPDQHKLIFNVTQA